MSPTLRPRAGPANENPQQALKRVKVWILLFIQLTFANRLLTDGPYLAYMEATAGMPYKI